MTPEEKKAYNKAYYQTHKKEIKARIESRREEIKAYHKIYYQSHKEERKEYGRAYSKAYRESHKEEISEKNKADYQAHKKGLIPDSKLNYLLMDKETSEIAEVPIKELCEMLGKSYDYVKNRMQFATETLGYYVVEE